MARFDLVADDILRFEGGYVNDPDDKGGETIFGISRKAHPNWMGWGYIDSLQDKKKAEHDPALKNMARNLYKESYWDIFELDFFPQKTAYEMFDISVNMGTKTATMFAQRIVNILSNTIEVEVDGAFGPKTKAAISAVLTHRGDELFAKLLNTLQGNKYIEIMERDYTQEKFIGWFKRI